MLDLQGTSVTWLGHATVLITTKGGTNILVDPWIEGNPSYPKGFKLPEKIDLLLITHGHADHFQDAVPVAKKYEPKVIGIMELVGWMEAHGVKNTVAMNFGGSVTHRDVTVSMVESKHTSSIKDGDRYLYAGNPAGFMIAVENAPVLYHAGDTALFSDMQLYKELYAPKLAMLPIGGHFTMGPRHAAIAARYLGVEQVLPLHFGTFPALTGSPDELKLYLEGSGIEVLVPQAGTALS